MSASRTGGSIEIRLPIRTVNALNERAHWSKRAARNKRERLEAYTVSYMLRGEVAPPCAVTLTREAVRQMDGDGLQASFKAVRDGVADRLGINDKDPRVEWVYAQRKGNPKQYGIEVQIEETNTA